MTEQEEDILRIIPLLRMEAKSNLEKYRYLMSVTNENYEKVINAILDRMSMLDKLEKELMKKK